MQAITHRSCADSIDYERYELLGDAFLKFATANHLYTTQRDADEGILSTEMHRRVSNGTLWRCAVVRTACSCSASCLTVSPCSAMCTSPMHLLAPRPQLRVREVKQRRCADNEVAGHRC
ncbi:MAG: hypothetical protein HC767_06060 [Akkermansiaceae bacterium]|nr:hypothetical protein [Akkermansiaceae bacterium]